MKRPALKTVAVLLLVSGCGSARDAVNSAPVAATVRPDAQTIGACVTEPDDPFLLSDRLRSSQRWYRLSHPIEDVPDRETVSREERRLVAVSPPFVNSAFGTPPSRLSIRATELPGLKAELAAGSELLVGVGSTGILPSLVVAMRPEGTPIFIGGCEYDHATQPLARFAAVRRPATAGASRSLLLEMIHDPTGPETAALEDFLTVRRSLPDWSAQSPDRRSIEKGVTPAETLGTLRSARLEYRLPETWKSFRGHLCSKVPGIGWNECGAFSLLEQGGDVTSLAYWSPTRPLEVWLLDDNGNVDNPLAKLITIPVGKLPSRGTLTLYGEPGPSTLQELIDAANDGNEVLRYS